MNWIIRNGKRISRITAGLALVIVGVILGPVPVIWGWPFVLAGISLLAYDFEWARRLKTGFSNRMRDAADRMRRKE